MATKTYKTRLLRDGSMCAIPVPFDPKAAFGRARAPVRVTINGYTYRSTVTVMGGPPFVPLRKSHREAAHVSGDEVVNVRLELDEAERTVTPPPDLVAALHAEEGAWAAWQALSFTHRREHVEAVESAKTPETRARRIERVVAMVRATAARRAARPPRR